MFKLDDLIIEFIMNNSEYTCNIYHMDSDNYCIRLHKGFNTNNSNELFSTYIDSYGGEVTCNAEVYTMDDIDDVIEKCYQIYNFYVDNKLLFTSDKEDL